MSERTTIYKLLNLQPASLEILQVKPSRWATEVTFECAYHFPPERKLFTLRFGRVRNLQWLVINPDAKEIDETQVLSHDLGAEGYRRTARFASTLAEIIISYDTLTIEKDW